MNKTLEENVLKELYDDYNWPNLKTKISSRDLFINDIIKNIIKKLEKGQWTFERVNYEVVENGQCTQYDLKFIQLDKEFKVFHCLIINIFDYIINWFEKTNYNYSEIDKEALIDYIIENYSNQSLYPVNYIHK